MGWCRAAQPTVTSAAVSRLMLNEYNVFILCTCDALETGGGHTSRARLPKLRGGREGGGSAAGVGWVDLSNLKDVWWERGGACSQAGRAPVWDPPYGTTKVVESCGPKFLIDKVA